VVSPKTPKKDPNNRFPDKFIQTSPTEPYDPKRRIKSLNMKFRTKGVKRKRLEYNINLLREVLTKQKKTG